MRRYQSLHARVLYDASPIPLKSIGLGEIASFLVWGPLKTLEYQTPAAMLAAIVASTP